jgi:stage III sporulation protein SpoIIIAA
MFNLFRGWFYDLPDNTETEQALVEPFLRFVFEIISNRDAQTAQQILGWIASIIQNVGKKSGVALLLIGDEGVGKNFFTDILSVLFKGYSLPNITDLTHVVGHFNEIIRGKVLIVINEVCLLSFFFVSTTTD